MPLPMIHLRVAVKIDIPDNLKTPEFYLGSISPDAVHMRQGFVPADKVRSHCNARSVDAIDALVPLCDNVRKTSGRKQAFLLGYLIHILTDLFWKDSLYKDFVREYEKDTAPIQEEKMAYYNDTDQLDFAFYEKENWRQAVWEQLETAEGFGVENMISQEEVLAWKQRTLKWYDSGKSQHTNPVKYISYAQQARFTEEAARECEKYLKANLWMEG